MEQQQQQLAAGVEEKVSLYYSHADAGEERDI